MAELFAIIKYFNEYFKFTAKLNTRYKAEIKPKIIKTSFGTLCSKCSENKTNCNNFISYPIVTKLLTDVLLLITDGFMQKSGK